MSAKIRLKLKFNSAKEYKKHKLILNLLTVKLRWCFQKATFHQPWWPCPSSKPRGPEARPKSQRLTRPLRKVRPITSGIKLRLDLEALGAKDFRILVREMSKIGNRFFFVESKGRGLTCVATKFIEGN